MTTDDERTQMTDERDSGRAPTLGEMSHTNPYTGEVFGDTQTYSRGKIVAADGGEADATDENESENEGDIDSETADRMADVDHTPPGAADGAQAAYERGYEENE